MDADDQTDIAPESAPRTPVSRKDFLERAIEKSGHKRRSEARAVVEATLAALGEVLTEGAEVNLSPLGKLRVVREKTTDRARVLNLRLSIPKSERGAGASAEAPALAGDDEAE